MTGNRAQPLTGTGHRLALAPCVHRQREYVGSDGGAPATVIRVGDQLRVTQIRVLHVAHKGRRLALLTIEDATEVFCLKAALDTSEYAAFVIDARGQVLAFNKPAGGLFGGAEIGADAAQLLAQPEAPARWWEPGLTGRRNAYCPTSIVYHRYQFGRNPQMYYRLESNRWRLLLTISY